MNNIPYLVTKMIKSLNSKKINYCHFKSNEHLDAALKADTDLDILFDFNQYKFVVEVLISLGFKKFNSAWFVNYPFIEDFIAINDGKIVHIHAHFKLTIGESKVKSYILPWDREVLENRIFIEDFGIYTSSPVMEMLLLIVRNSFKLPISNISYNQKRDIIDSRREFVWLKNKVSKKELIELSSKKFGSHIAEIIQKIYDENLTYSNIKNFSISTKKYFEEYRRYTYLKSWYVKIIRRFAQNFAAFNKKFLIFKNIKNHRTFIENGMVVALVGADGSGKSTQVKILKEKLSTKIDTRYIYLGSGNGPASWHRIILNLVKKIKNKKNEIHTLPSVVQKDLKNINFSLKKVFYFIYSISLAFEKKKKLKTIFNYKKNGMIVLTDRFPQTQNYGYNDGPLLGDFINSKNFFDRKVASFELSLYQYTKKIYPDIVIKLLGDLQVLYSRRKNDMTYDLIEKKQNSIKELVFSGNSRLIEVDATLDKVEIKKIILNKIGEYMANK